MWRQERKPRTSPRGTPAIPWAPEPQVRGRVRSRGSASSRRAAAESLPVGGLQRSRWLSRRSGGQRGEESAGSQECPPGRAPSVWEIEGREVAVGFGDTEVAVTADEDPSAGVGGLAAD